MEGSVKATQFCCLGYAREANRDAATSAGVSPAFRLTPERVRR
jgi:hypothetical protein